MMKSSRLNPLSLGLWVRVVLDCNALLSANADWSFSFENPFPCAWYNHWVLSLKLYDGSRVLFCVEGLGVCFRSFFCDTIQAHFNVQTRLKRSQCRIHCLFNNGKCVLFIFYRSWRGPTYKLFRMECLMGSFYFSLNGPVAHKHGENNDGNTAHAKTLWPRREGYAIKLTKHH
jgi:hypothetical protein